MLLLAFSSAIAACATPNTRAAADAGPATPARRYGDAMSEVGRRFELAGRAAAAGRFALARFEIGEIDEVFDEDLPHAEPPKERANVDLAALAKAFAETNLPALDRAADARDRAAFARAFQEAAVACNGCHAGSGHGFIDIAGELGQGVPRLDAVRPDDDAGAR
jgi:mono/diheme cytochrome c family protein